MIEDLGRRHLPVIDAREVLSRIENGSPVIYDHVAIAGDLDLRKIDLPRIHFERPAGEEQTASTVACSIQIRNCELLGNVNLDHASSGRAWTSAGASSSRRRASRACRSPVARSSSPAAFTDMPHSKMPISPDAPGFRVQPSPP